MVCLFVVELIIHRKLSLSAADNFSACEHNNWHQCFWCQMGCMRLSMPHYTQCLNCEKLAGGWSFRQSETEQNCDVNCMYTVYSWPPVHNLTVSTPPPQHSAIRTLTIHHHAIKLSYHVSSALRQNIANNNNYYLEASKIVIVWMHIERASSMLSQHVYVHTQQTYRPNFRK